MSNEQLTPTRPDPETIQERVNQVCDDLYRQGTKVTIRLVQTALAGTVSSTSTVHKYYNKWKEQNKANEKSLYDQLGFSSDFTQAFMREISRFKVEVEQRYKDEAEEANDAKAVAFEALDKAETRLENQSALLSQAQKSVSELERELDLVQTRYDDQLKQEQQRHQVIVDELRQQLEQQVADNRQLAADNEQSRTELAKAELKLEGNEAYVAEVKHQSTELQADNKSLSQQINELSKQVATMTVTIEGNNKLIESLEGRSQSLNQSIDALQTEKQELSATTSSLRQELQTASTGHANIERQLAEARTRMDEMTRTIADHQAAARSTDKLVAQLEGQVDGLKADKQANAEQIQQLEKSLKDSAENIELLELQLEEASK